MIRPNAPFRRVKQNPHVLPSRRQICVYNHLARRQEMNSYPDVTDDVIDMLIAQKILVDRGKDIFDKDEPDIYIRRLELY